MIKIEPAIPAPEGFKLLKSDIVTNEGLEWIRGKVRCPDGQDRYFAAAIEPDPTTLWSDIWLQMEIATPGAYRKRLQRELGDSDEAKEIIERLAP